MVYCSLGQFKNFEGTIRVELEWKCSPLVVLASARLSDVIPSLGVRSGLLSLFLSLSFSDSSTFPSPLCIQPGAGRRTCTWIFSPVPAQSSAVTFAHSNCVSVGTVHSMHPFSLYFSLSRCIVPRSQALRGKPPQCNPNSISRIGLQISNVRPSQCLDQQEAPLKLGSSQPGPLTYRSRYNE